MRRSVAILNPNSTAAMTDDMAKIGREVAPSGVEITALTNAAGPPAIQGEADAIACLPGLFALTETPAAKNADAVIIGCFDDTGLTEIRARSPRPVIGLGEAGMLAAALAAPRFAVLTTTTGSVPVIAGNIEAMRLSQRCDGVEAAGVPVLELIDRTTDLRRALFDIARRTKTGAIVLGCAGMGRLAPDLAAPGLPPLIDPVRAAVMLAVSTATSRFAA